MTDIIVQIGGIGRGRPNDVLNIQYTYRIPVNSTTSGSTGLSIRGVAELNNCISGYYELVVNQPTISKVEYAAYWGNQIIQQLGAIVTAGMFRILATNQNVLIGITPSFTYRENLDGNFVGFKKTSFMPKYVEAESTGYIEFTPEFNIPTTFDNANFVRAEDDNYTSKIREFINSPQFNLALFVRPKIYDHCGNEKCKKCWKRHICKVKCQKWTITSALEALVKYMYMTSVAVQKEEITFEEGKARIDDKVNQFEQYRTEGARTYEFLKDENGFIELIFCTRYHLEKFDCIVGFTLQGIEDIFTNRPEPEFNQVLMNASAVPIDEDMSDAIFPANTGLFVYKNK